MSRSEAVLHQPEIVVNPGAVREDVAEVVIGSGFDVSTPGTDYIWYDCSGDSFE